MPGPKLYYFDAAGLADPLRLIALVAGTDFEDVRIPLDKWPTLKASKAPGGTLPFLELEDGTLIGQSDAVRRYLEGLDKERVARPPTDDLMWRAVQDEVNYSLDEAVAGLAASFRMPDDEKKKAREIWAAADGPFEKGMKYMDSKVNAAGFFGGDRVCFAEIRIYFVYFLLGSGIVDYFSKDMLQKYPNLVKVAGTVEKLPAVVAYRKAQADTKLLMIPSSP